MFIAFTTPEEHKHHLQRVFENLNDHVIVINHIKCEWCHLATALGHQVDTFGVCLVEKKVNQLEIFLNQLPNATC